MCIMLLLDSFDLADPFYVGSYPVPLVLYVTSGLFLYESGGTPL